MNIGILATICIVTVLYIHIHFQLHTSNDLEIYEIAMPTKPKLEEVCNFKQPVLFDYYEETISQCTLDSLDEYSAFDVMVFDDTHVGISLPLEKARELFNETDRDYVKFIKAHYLYGGSYRPYAVDSVDFYVPADKREEVEPSSFLVNRLAFLAH
jgi:hypothetical protein